MFQSLPTTQDDFYQSILTHTLFSLKVNTFFDNFDKRRFNTDGKDYSKDFNVSNHVFYFDWFFKNYSHLFSAYEALQDGTSKRLYLYLIAYRLAGHLCIKIPVDFIGKTAERDEYDNAEKYTESTLPLEGMFGKLKHFNFSYKGHQYVIDCLNLENSLFRGQYFYNKSGVSIQPEQGDYVIDGGACLGDTAIVFSNAVGEEGKVYSFDPVADHLEIINHNVKQFPLKNVAVMPYGLSNENVEATPVTVNHYSPGFKAHTHKVPLRSIDDMVSKGEIEKVDFIKLDVEGSELNTLKGAVDSIQKFKPKIAVSIYHGTTDFYEIILHVKNTFPFYKLYLDHYTIHHEETVLYCSV